MVGGQCVMSAALAGRARAALLPTRSSSSRGALASAAPGVQRLRLVHDVRASGIGCSLPQLLLPRLKQQQQQHNISCSSSSGYSPDYGSSALSELKKSGPNLRSVCWLNFWLQLPLTIVSAVILIFSAFLTRAPQDPTKWFTFVGVIFALLSTFFAHGFLTLARRLVDGENVRREWLMGNLLRNNTLNLCGIGVTLVGLQSAVGTLVAKTFLQSANQPYVQPQPGSTLVSLDVFALQASTNTLLAHFLSLVFTNLILRILNRTVTSKA